ncbi:MAG: hypothetical protein JNK48_00565 [Bryobacterales bacterium]|nr:hypothetical protein [Bryobacterales bacterium]
MKAVIDAILARPEALGMAAIADRCDSYVMPNFDANVYRNSPEFLRPHSKRYAHALVMCDRVGSGQTRSRQEMEDDIESRLSSSGWMNRGSAIVIDPELEAWLWQRSPYVVEALGWNGRSPDLYSWLDSTGFLAPGASKPADPKKALNAALFLARKQKSSSIFSSVASQVSLARCIDPSFLKLREVLRSWFPRPDNTPEQQKPQHAR